MPKICSVGGCTNHHLQESKFSFFKFPNADKDGERRKRWIWACGRQNPDGSEWKPTAKYLYICSQHFITGKPSLDPEHPDYIPNITQRTPTSAVKGEKKLHRFTSARKRRRILHDQEENIDSPASKLPLLETDDSQNDSEQENLHVTVHKTTIVDNNENLTGFSRPLQPSEREMMIREINNLREERDIANAKLADSLDIIRTTKLSAEMIKEDDEKCKFYTGLSWPVFEKTFLFLNDDIRPPRQNSVPARDQFFMTLVKLRQNPNFEYLADQLSIGKTTVIELFWKWIDIIEARLSFLIKWPDRERIFRSIPPVFRVKYPRLTNIIDCFEIFIESPKNLKARAQCYSNYKKHTTVKFLIGCNPLGGVVFLSKGWGGRVSDVELTRNSGYISRDLHFPGDQILADRGFTLQEEIATECSAELILPAFTKGKKQLPARDVEVSRSFASVRILIERVIGLMKSRFAILQGTLPIRIVKSGKSEAEDDELSSVDKLVRACASLTNLGDKIVYKDL